MTNKELQDTLKTLPDDYKVEVRVYKDVKNDVTESYFPTDEDVRMNSFERKIVICVA